jgi:hypothetical protein
MFMVVRTTNTLPIQKIIKTIEVVLQVLRSNSGRSFSLRVLRTNIPRIIAYRSATAAASVGVKTPPRIPPMIITGVIKGRKARRKLDHRLEKENLPLYLGYPSLAAMMDAVTI